MAKITFQFEPPVMEVTPEEYLEACSSSEIHDLIECLNDDFHSQLKNCIFLTPDEFLEKCNHLQLEETYELLHEQYGMGQDDDARSEGQRKFNHYLSCLREGWLAVTKEDAEIISVLAKKYGAV